MQLFYGGVSLDLVSFEANINFQYIYKHKITSIILILGTSSWSTYSTSFRS
jgi:hypothetical protein